LSNQKLHRFCRIGGLLKGQTLEEFLELFEAFFDRDPFVFRYFLDELRRSSDQYTQITRKKILLTTSMIFKKAYGMAYSGLLGRNTDINGFIACATLTKTSTSDLAPPRIACSFAFAFCPKPRGWVATSSSGNFLIYSCRNSMMIAGRKSSSDENSNSLVSDTWLFRNPKRLFASLAAL
jgi:hypothetical protein